MAKLGLIFICVFLMVQLSTSAPQRKESGSDGNESTFRGMMNEVMTTLPKEAMKKVSEMFDAISEMAAKLSPTIIGKP